jgi:low affinity Fe/Cu permease
MIKKMKFRKAFSSLADAVSNSAGRPEAFLLVLLLTLGWLLSGYIYGWSDAWQLVANTVTNVVTFIMVFVIQNSQNRDSAALQAKLDELIRSSSARNELVGIEKLTQEEIEALKEKNPHRPRH